MCVFKYLLGTVLIEIIIVILTILFNRPNSCLQQEAIKDREILRSKTIMRLIKCDRKSLFFSIFIVRVGSFL